MTKMIHVERVSRASPEQVFALLADVTRWTEWGPFTRAELERPAPGDDPNGLGSVRRLQAPGAPASHERVIAYEPGRRFGYELVHGLPLRDYRAHVTLEPLPGGTRITWHSEFRPKLPGTGWFYRAVLQGFIARATRQLAEAAEVAAA
jgi:hypothetical protein